MSVALVVDHGQMEQQIDHGFIGVSPSMNDRSLDDMKLHGAVVRADDTIDGDDDDLKVTPDLKGTLLMSKPTSTSTSVVFERSHHSPFFAAALVV